MKVQRLVGEYFIYNKPTTKTCNHLLIDDIVWTLLKRKGGKG